MRALSHTVTWVDPDSAWLVSCLEKIRTQIHTEAVQGRHSEKDGYPKAKEKIQKKPVLLTS
jgi:hypothetical protein